MEMGKGKEDAIGSQITPTLEWLLNADVGELLKKALEDDWPQPVFERWLRVKEVLYLEKIAF